MYFAGHVKHIWDWSDGTNALIVISMGWAVLSPIKSIY